MISVHHISCKDQIFRTINHLAMDIESLHIIQAHFNGDRQKIRPFYSKVSVVRIHQTTAPHSARSLEFSQ